MAKTRTYYKCQTSVEVHIYEGVKILAHLIYYPAKGYYCPRYHFENFGLLLPNLNYEILRFMKFVQKVISNPHIDLEHYDGDSDFDDFKLF